MAAAAVAGSLTAHDRRILTALNTGASSLSFVGSGFIVLCYCLFKELRKFSFKLVFFLALSVTNSLSLPHILYFTLDLTNFCLIISRFTTEALTLLPFVILLFWLGAFFFFAFLYWIAGHAMQFLQYSRVCFLLKLNLWLIGSIWCEVEMYVNVCWRSCRDPSKGLFCSAQGYSTHFFCVASFLWTTTIAFTLHRTVVQHKTDVEDLEAMFHLYVWGNDYI